MQIHEFLAHCRRRFQEDPDLLAGVDLDDALTVLSMAAALEADAEAELAEIDRELQAAAPDRRHELAERFRRTRGMGGPHGR